MLLLIWSVCQRRRYRTGEVARWHLFGNLLACGEVGCSSEVKDLIAGSEQQPKGIVDGLGEFWPCQVEIADPCLESMEFDGVQQANDLFGDGPAHSRGRIFQPILKGSVV